jgi:hypothetical protein
VLFLPDKGQLLVADVLCRALASVDGRRHSVAHWLQPFVSSLVTVSATAALMGGPCRWNTRIRRRSLLTLRISSSPIVDRSRFSSVISCSPFRSVQSRSLVRISIGCGLGGSFARSYQSLFVIGNTLGSLVSHLSKNYSGNRWGGIFPVPRGTRFREGSTPITAHLVPPFTRRHCVLSSGSTVALTSRCGIRSSVSGYLA